jgi:superkiller protein 3
MHFLHLGDALFRLKDLGGAIRTFQNAERLDPHLALINYLIGYAYQNNGQFEEAGEFYQRQLTIDPNHVESLVGAGVVAVEQSHFNDAEKFLNLALTHNPDDVQANYELGLLWFKTHRYDHAIEVFKHVLWLRPDHTQAEYYLYLALSRSHEDASAETALANWKKLEALDRKVRSEEVAYEAAREAHWMSAAALAP